MKTQITELLKEKSCMQVKADNGNAVVILDWSDYVSAAKKLLEEGSNPGVKKDLESRKFQQRLNLSYTSRAKIF